MSSKDNAVDHAQVVALDRFPHLEVRLDTPKGRGVFATRSIAAGTVIETCPVLPLNPAEYKQHIEHTTLHHYTYNWPVSDADGTNRTSQAIILGLGSMFNHSRKGQNVGWRRDIDRLVVIYSALRDIGAGEELCISYGDRLTFDDVEGNAETSDAEPDPEEVLSRIDIDA